MVIHLLWYILFSFLYCISDLLPISADAYYSLITSLDLISFNEYNFIVIVYLGLLISLILYERFSIRKIIDEQPQHILLILIGCIPAIIIYILLEEIIDRTFMDQILVVVCLVVNALILLYVQLYSYYNKRITFRRLDIIGMSITQILGVFPGISRMAVTLMSGTFTNLSPKRTKELSLIIYIPLCFAILLYNIPKTSFILSMSYVYISALLISIISSFIALRCLNQLISHRLIWLCSLYSIILGIIIYII